MVLWLSIHDLGEDMVGMANCGKKPYMEEDHDHLMKRKVVGLVSGDSC